MRQPFSLKLLKLFKPMLCKMGVEYEQLERILSLKLLMDSRKTSIFTKKEGKSAFRYEYFINLFLGFVLMIILLEDAIPLFCGETIVLAAAFMYTIFYILADYSTVILDLRDKMIIGRTPVNERTINMAKIVHVIIYLSQMILSIMILPLGATLMAKGFIYFLILLCETIFLTIFSLSLTAMLYYVLVSKFSGEKLKDIINVVQIIFMIITILVQQLMPRIFQFTEGVSITYNFKWWYYLLPPFWMSAPFEIVENGMTNVGYVGLTICGILIPIVLFILYTTKMAPFFETKLAKMNSGEGKVIRKKKDRNLGAQIGRWLCKDKEEYQFYNFIRQMLSTERKFKLQVYPSLAMAVIFPVIMALIMVDLDSPAGWLEAIRSEKLYFFAYFTCTCTAQCFITAQHSENSKAAWIYELIPIKSENIIYKGFLKAVAVKYLLPLTLYQSIFIILVWGISSVQDVIVITINSFVIFLLYFMGLGKHMPFSKSYNSEANGNVGMTFLMMFVTMIVGGVHYGLSKAFAYSNIIIGMIGVITFVIVYRMCFLNKKAKRLAEV